MSTEGTGITRYALALDLVDVDTHAEMAWMAKAYAKEIAALTEHFDGVRVRWGLLRWCL